MNAMNRRTIFTLTALAFLWLGVILPAGNAVGQQAGSTLKDQLVGSWTPVAIYTEREDGTKFDTFGPKPTGVLTFGSDGRLSLQWMRSDLPKFASNDRQNGTPEENKAIVQGSLSYFGTYTVDDAAKTMVIHIEGCSFPNWNGKDQKRSFALARDELTLSG